MISSCSPSPFKASPFSVLPAEISAAKAAPRNLQSRVRDSATRGTCVQRRVRYSMTRAVVNLGHTEISLEDACQSSRIKSGTGKREKILFKKVLQTCEPVSTCIMLV